MDTCWGLRFRITVSEQVYLDPKLDGLQVSWCLIHTIFPQLREVVLLHRGGPLDLVVERGSDTVDVRIEVPAQGRRL